MRVLIVWGSTRGGTAGLAQMLGEALGREGLEVEMAPARAASAVGRFDAVIVGGALYANRWHRAARRFVNRNAKKLRALPVWLFSSGPLDDSAAKQAVPPVPEVQVLMDRIGAQGHATFGGRLAADARGFPARAMARTHAGDWRDPAQVRVWASEIARALPAARPRPAVEPVGRSFPRLLGHALVGWAACATAMAVVLRIASPGVAVAVHALLVPVVFAVVARHYFRARGAREALTTAAAFTVTVGALDLTTFGGVARTWLPLLLVFAATYATGAIMAMMPPAATRPRPG
jgi:menaquinone-dependent protoporphyrinogen oxidase